MRASVLAAAVRGSGHVAAGRPCQDAVATRAPDARGPVAVVAVADGHGSASSPRSDIGARVAVDITVELVAELLEQGLSGPGLDDLPGEIVRRWRDRVLDDARADPPVEPLPPGGVEVLYGATLLFAGVGPDGVLVGQVGDGDILLVSDSGGCERAFAHDPRLVGNETTSLCTHDAHREFRLRVCPVQALPALCVLSTDGYFNSFVDDDAYLQAGGDFLVSLRDKGRDYVEAMLVPWLEETTQLGAGDDVSVGLLQILL